MTKVTRGFCPWGCLRHTCDFIHLLNHEMMCIKSEAEEIPFKLVTNNHSDEAFLLTSTFWSFELSAPAQGLCLNLLSSITADFKISSALR